MSTRTRSELIQGFARTPERVAALVATFSADALASKPSPEEFSVREHVHHLRDLEVEGWSARLERLLTEAAPELPGIDGDRLARERRYNERDHEMALGEFACTRAGCVMRLERLTDEEWKRAGTLGPSGPVTVERLVEIWYEHDLGHVNDLETLSKRAGANK